MALTKVTGHVVLPTTNIEFHNTKSTGIVTFAHTNNATSSTTGALQVTGGVGIVKDLHVGGNVTVGGTLTYDDVTNIDSLGIITARGGINVSGGNVTITNDLDVDGHTDLDNVSIAGVTTFTNSYVDFKPGNGGNAHFRILSTGTGDAGIFFDAANGDISGSDYCFIGQKNIDFQRAGNTQIRITGIGSVGIGTTNPDGQLHISSGTSGDCRVYIEADKDNNNEGDNPFIIFKNDGGIENASVWSGNTDGGTNDNSLNLSASTSVNGGIRFFTSGTDGGWETAAHRARITPDGELLINAVTERSYVDGAGNTQTPKLQVVSNSNVDTAISLRYNSGAGAANRRASFIFARTADGTAVSNNSVLGEVLFMGEGNSTLEKAASIRAEVDGTPGTNDMPGRLIFSTSHQRVN